MPGFPRALARCSSRRKSARARASSRSCVAALIARDCDSAGYGDREKFHLARGRDRYRDEMKIWNWGRESRRRAFWQLRTFTARPQRARAHARACTYARTRVYVDRGSDGCRRRIAQLRSFIGSSSPHSLSLAFASDARGGSPFLEVPPRIRLPRLYGSGARDSIRALGGEMSRMSGGVLYRKNEHKLGYVSEKERERERLID